MLWEVEWGSKVKALLEEQSKSGKPNARLATRPRLVSDGAQYWEAYWDLSSGRQFNEAGLQPFSPADILAYVDLSGIPRGEPAILLGRMVRAMDRAYLNWAAKKRQNNKPTGKK